MCIRPILTRRMENVMDDKKDCSIAACCKANWCGIFGVVLVSLAVILTLITSSDFGILGMFLVGAMFCCHKHMASKGCGTGCACGCKCCGSSADMCDVSAKANVVVEKKTAAKK